MLDFINPKTLQAEAFRADVIDGLSKAKKTLPSRWLYDDAGSALFEEITRIKEYYPTRTETAILQAYADDIAYFAGPEAVVIEYGAGAGIKTKMLIESLTNPAAYVPIDIAGDFLASTVRRMTLVFPAMRTWPVVADFTTDFRMPTTLPEGRRLAFFPGSTLGNLDREQSESFLRRMRDHVGAGGRAIIGIDLVKDTSVLRAAYDDAEGVTAAFNLNILRRINRELDGNFAVNQFFHKARWNEGERAVEMHLVSSRRQSVVVDDQTFEFSEGESIHTESSRKYDIMGIRALASRTEWELDHVWTDEKGLFAVVGLVTEP